jgi:hypothetical protein
LAVLLLLLSTSAACDKKDKIVVENVIPAETNQPPVIVAMGPEMPPGGFVETDYFLSGIDLWALVGDPNGLDDISLVAMDMDSVRLVRYIVRPDTSASSCIAYGYAPGDTVAMASILPVPARFPGVKFLPLTQEQGGLFRSAGLGVQIGAPDIIDTSPVLERWNGGCGGGYEVYGPFYVLPPAVPDRREASVSYAQMEYYGVKVTVYDTAGASASASYPTLRVTLKVPQEPTPLP